MKPSATPSTAPTRTPGTRSSTSSRPGVIEAFELIHATARLVVGAHAIGTVAEAARERVRMFRDGLRSLHENDGREDDARAGLRRSLDKIRAFTAEVKREREVRKSGVRMDPVHGDLLVMDPVTGQTQKLEVVLREDDARERLAESDRYIAELERAVKEGESETVARLRRDLAEARRAAGLTQTISEWRLREIRRLKAEKR